MRKVMLLALAVVACVAISASADVANWQSQATATAGNVVADGTERTFDGTAGTGIDFDYGALDAIDGKPVDGSTVEFIVNFSDAGTSIALGSMSSGMIPGNSALRCPGTGIRRWPLIVYLMRMFMWFLFGTTMAVP
jgi:hypothetical protein